MVSCVNLGCAFEFHNKIWGRFCRSFANSSSLWTTLFATSLYDLETPQSGSDITIGLPSSEVLLISTSKGIWRKARNKWNVIEPICLLVFLRFQFWKFFDIILLCTRLLKVWPVCEYWIPVWFCTRLYPNFLLRFQFWKSLLWYHIASESLQN